MAFQKGVSRMVLLVDDNARGRFAMRRVLQGEGFSVAEAATAREAWACLNSQTFEAMVLDYRLPDKNGDELLEQVRASFPTLKVFVWSGDLTAQRRAMLIEKGAKACIDKSRGASIVLRALQMWSGVP